MSDYISRSYLRKMAMFEPEYTMESPNDADTLFRLINDAPKADAERVVRCRNCKHRKDGLYCRRTKTPFITTNIDFCSFGKEE